MNEIGYVTKSQEYFIFLEGLPSARINDVVEGPNGAVAMILSLSDTYMSALMLNNVRAKPGDEFVLKSDGIQVPESTNLLGRAINPLGRPLDGKGTIKGSSKRVYFELSPDGVKKRNSISSQFTTGLTTIDMLLPIGKGQRQLLIGEPRSGKVAFLIDVIVSQKGKKSPTMCIYTLIGKSQTDMRRFTDNLTETGAFEHTIVIGGLSSEPAPLISIAPTVAFSIADQFRELGIDTLVILDDFGTHAKYLREITLVTDHIPGRELFPGDIHYQQAHLLERGGNFKYNDKKSVSTTVLPVIETTEENYTGLIATNIMGSTDGHVLFSNILSAEGQYPAIDVLRSITRLGKQTQTQFYQQLSDELYMLLSKFRESRSYNRFGTGMGTIVIQKGQILTEILRQEQRSKADLKVHAILLSLLFTRFYDDSTIEIFKSNKQNLINLISSNKMFTDLTTKIDKLKLSQVVEALNTEQCRTALRSAYVRRRIAPTTPLSKNPAVSKQ